MSVAMMINEELKGIELKFDQKPAASILSELKENGFRWSAFKKVWYAKQSQKTFKVAEMLTNSESIDQPKTIKTAKEIKFNLWQSTQWEEIEVNQQQGTKEIAKEIRVHIKKRFPQCKFSVRSTYNKIDLEIKCSPYEKGSIYLDAIVNYCTQLVDAYNYCVSYDPYGDYGSSYSFYSHVGVDWEYKQTEANETVKKDIELFDLKAIETEKEEEKRKEKEYAAFQVQMEQNREKAKQREKEEKQRIETIYNNIRVNNLIENNQYYIVGAEFAHLNKQNTIKEYQQEVKKGDYSVENVKVTKEIHFNSVEAFENFSNMFLSDFSFLENTGGSFTEDNRVNSMIDFYNMDELSKKSVAWTLKGVAIYFNGKLQYVVDAQGYSYARYVGLTDNAKIEKDIAIEQVRTNKEIEELQQQAERLTDISTGVISDLDIISTWNNDNWKLYKDKIKLKLNKYKITLTSDIIQQIDIEDLKISMYKLLQEVDGIQEQFNDAAIEQGEKVTLFYISDFGSMITSRITLDSVTNTKYAQYDNAVKLTFKPEGKRKLHYQFFHSKLLAYKGWMELPETVLNTVEENGAFKTIRSKYLSCDEQQYDEILNHFDKQGINPIVNTHKPRF
ncbi:hypothetical protein LCM23_06380 [Cytobacillus kochii]|uniref:LPD29 domain-containing protein n=1 Tax=Cytobacillus kochii TaxID=859143 RepID=UPI001CD260DD|nr:LPD29 domain-containing protein [Cytobacillus kochii]MCA1025712.1 hypothetical protein [Cytobacillus kochii]